MMDIPSFPEVAGCATVHRPEDRPEPLHVASQPVPATLADLLARVAADERLPSLRRRDLLSSGRTFARATSRTPEAIRADPRAIRGLMNRVLPRAAGISQKRWSNVRADLASMLKRYDLAGCARPGFLPEWLALRRRIKDKAIECGLSRLIRFCSDHGIPPDRVDQAVFDDFGRCLDEETLVPHPRHIAKRAAQQWNRAVRLIPGWPDLVVAVPSLIYRFGLPKETFPGSFRDEVDRWAACMAGADLLGDGPPKPLRPVTVKHEVGQIYRFASALVHAGHDPERITSIAYLVELEHFTSGLRFFLERRGAKTSPGLSEMATLLTRVARHWVKVDENHLKQLNHLKGRVSCQQRGLTEKNRHRLRQFDDPTALSALLDLPERLVNLGRRSGIDRSAALLVQTGLMIEVLLHAPMRLSNFVQLNLHRHFVRRGRAFHVVIPGYEVKNDEPFEFPLPPQVMRLFDLYVRNCRPLLLSGDDHGWLWPGRLSGPKHKTTATDQIVIALKRHVGVDMNVHLFRHFAAKLRLEQDPGNYESVRQLLGHKSIDTTTMFYTGFDTAAAAKLYHEKVLNQRRPDKRGQIRP